MDPATSEEALVRPPLSYTLVSFDRSVQWRVLMWTPRLTRYDPVYLLTIVPGEIRVKGFAANWGCERSWQPGSALNPVCARAGGDSFPRAPSRASHDGSRGSPRRWRAASRGVHITGQARSGSRRASGGRAERGVRGRLTEFSRTRARYANDLHGHGRADSASVGTDGPGRFDGIAVSASSQAPRPGRGCGQSRGDRRRARDRCHVRRGAVPAPRPYSKRLASAAPSGLPHPVTAFHPGPH